MRCWDCDSIIIIPEVIDGEPGVAGQMRAGVRKVTEFKPRTVTQEFFCTRCGTRYIQTTTRMPGKYKIAPAPTPTDAETERDRLWKG